MKKDSINKWILTVIVLVVLSVALYLLVNARDRAISGDAATNISEGKRVISLYDLDLSDLEPQQSISAGGEEFRGYPIGDILEKGGIEADTVAVAVFVSADGIRIMVSQKELISGNVVLGSQTVKGKTDYRLIFLQDRFRNRWIKNITSIEVE